MYTNSLLTYFHARPFPKVYICCSCSEIVVFWQSIGSVKHGRFNMYQLTYPIPNIPQRLISAASPLSGIHGRVPLQLVPVYRNLQTPSHFIDCCMHMSSLTILSGDTSSRLARRYLELDMLEGACMLCRQRRLVIGRLHSQSSTMLNSKLLL